MSPSRSLPPEDPAATACEATATDRAGRRALVLVVTGPSRAGKTTVCRRVVEAAGRRRLSIAGLLTEDGTDEAGNALQIVRDLSSNRCHLLAQARPGKDGARAGYAVDLLRRPESPYPPDGYHLRWEFDAEGLEFGREALRVAGQKACDLLVVDQIGPLEMRHGGGWTCVFELVRAGRFGLALVVVNPAVVDEFVATLDHPCRVLRVDEAGRSALPATIEAAHLV